MLISIYPVFERRLISRLGAHFPTRGLACRCDARFKD